MLRGIASEPLDEHAERKIGELLARARTSDVVDAHIATMAGVGDDILTGDVEDIRHLLNARDMAAGIVAV